MHIWCVQPIMGPVKGITFGWYIKNWELFKKSLWLETLSLLMCMLEGFVVGFFWVLADPDTQTDWPTFEMYSRGDPEGLPTAFWVAVVS